MSFNRHRHQSQQYTKPPSSPPAASPPSPQSPAESSQPRHHRRRATAPIGAFERSPSHHSTSLQHPPTEPPKLRKSPSTIHPTRKQLKYWGEEILGNLFPWAAAALKEERSERRSDRDRVDGDQGDGRRKSRPSSINSRRKSSTPSSPPGSPKLHKSSPSSSSRYDAGMTTDEVIYKMGDVLVASPAGEAVKRYFNEHDHAGETKLRHARCIVDQLMDGKHFSASEVVGWVLPELRDFMEGTEQSRGWKEKREAEERNEIEDMVKELKRTFAVMDGREVRKLVAYAVGKEKEQGRRRRRSSSFDEHRHERSGSGVEIL